MRYGNQNFEGQSITYRWTVGEIERLCQCYPVIKKSIIGKSIMGKDIFLLQIGRGSRNVFYAGAFHANEGITAAVLLRFVEEHAQRVVNARWMYEQITLYVAPLVNPDGVDLVSRALTEGAYYQQAVAIATQYPEIPFPDGWKANIAGTDLNLQFPADWELAKEIKFAMGYYRPAPRDYVGEAPLSAPESRAVYDFVREKSPSLILAYHTQGEVIYWKYKDKEPVHSREIAAYFQYVSGYEMEETPFASGNAGLKDWFILQFNRPGYTIEAGLGENPLPMSQFDRIYQDNQGILLGAMIQTVLLL